MRATTTLADPNVAAALDRMYSESVEQMATLRARFDGVDVSKATAQERADALSDVYMPETQPYLDYVRNAVNGYVSVNFLARDSDSMELSCRA